MTDPEQFDPDDVIIDGLYNYTTLVGDADLAKAGAMVYRDVADVFRQHLKLGDRCTLAFPSMVIRPDARAACFVGVLSTGLAVAWRKGMLRKTTHSVVIPAGSVVDVEWEVSKSSSSLGALLVTAKGKSDSVTFAAVKDRPDIADAIRDAVRQLQ